MPTTVAGSLKNNRMRKELSIDIPIVVENDLMCHESIIDVSLAMEPAWWPECCIYRAPKKLREVNKEAYTPKQISIGPFTMVEKKQETRMVKENKGKWKS